MTVCLDGMDFEQTAVTQNMLHFQASALWIVKQQMILDIWSKKKGICFSA